jgi:two-component system, NtrC family, response regulator AtoC
MRPHMAFTGGPEGATRPTRGTGAAPRGRYLLVVGEGQFETHGLPDDGQVVIGRDADCDVQLKHPKISRRHARVWAHGKGGVEIEDLGSMNGIKVGGRRIERGVPSPLAANLPVRLGPYTALLMDVDPGDQRTADGVPRAAIVVRDPTLEESEELVARIAASAVSVLIAGETGTGKEVLAQSVHKLSGRAGQIVGINCAALGESLLESELFGHERGAFTGAVRAKPGLFEVAAGGTVFLDEIGDLPLALQGKLLRALETRQAYRVGGVQPVQLDIRIIAATHRNLIDDVASGRFRQDLYFRLNGITLEIPPLRARRDAIPRLAARFLNETARAANHTAPRLGAAALAALDRHPWPGNVRELRLVIERAVLLAGRDREIGAAHVILDPAPAPRTPEPARSPTPRPTPRPAGPGSDERARFLAVARAHHGNVSAIARELATSRSQVRRLAERWEIDLDHLRDSR